MATPLHLLRSKQIEGLPAGKHNDGGGLYLIVDKGGARRWNFFFSMNGKRREMGLGGFPSISLEVARKRADEARKLVAAGADPIAEKKAAAKKVDAPTFRACAEDYLKLKGPSFRNEKHLAQWRATIGLSPIDTAKVRIDRKAHEAYASALAALLAQPIDEVDVSSVLSVISPLWTAAPETASRVRGRIEMVLDAARVAGHRTGDNPARWAGNLALTLPARTRASRGHHAAAPYSDVPGIVARLRATGGTSALALEFAILTAARTGEVLGATWAEIDLKAAVWTVSSARMKAGREHRVPLVDRALAILKAMATVRRNDSPSAFVFPGQKPRSPLSTMALAMALRRAYDGEATPHGFRSTFRDWAGDMTDFPREIAEAALAHAVGDETELAYRRGDALERRRNLMSKWAEYIEN